MHATELEILRKTESLGGFAGYDMNPYAEALACSRELTDSLIDTPIVRLAWVYVIWMFRPLTLSILSNLTSSFLVTSLTTVRVWTKAIRELAERGNVPDAQMLKAKLQAKLVFEHSVKFSCDMTYRTDHACPQDPELAQKQW